MQYVIEGLGFGVFLAVAMGPIFIMLSQTAIEKGWRSGIAVGLGVWISDILYIYCSYRFIKSIEPTLNNPIFRIWVGTIGGALLIAFGIIQILKKKKLSQESFKLTAKNLAQSFSKGFAVNTFNPFTPIFWLGLVSTYIIGRGINSTEASILLGTIMIVIISSDSAKVFLAQYIRKKLSEKHLHYINVISGSFLIVFGLAMVLRVL